MHVQTPAQSAAADAARRTGYDPFPRTARDEGSEVALSRFALGYRIVGWLLTAVGVPTFMWGALDVATSRGSGVALGAGFALVAAGGTGLFFAALLSGAADVIRLLKRANNLPYSGEIEL